MMDVFDCLINRSTTSEKRISKFKGKSIKITLTDGISLVVQWLRIHLPIQGIPGGLDPWRENEDSTCYGATKPN